MIRLTRISYVRSSSCVVIWFDDYEKILFLHSIFQENGGGGGDVITIEEVEEEEEEKNA